MGLGRHIKKYTIRGFLAIVPISLSIFAIKVLYTAVDQRMMKLMDRFIGFSFPGLGLIIILVSLYLLGLITSNLLGKQIFRLIDHIAGRIPLIRTTQKIGQQLVDTLSLPEKQVFKKAVLVPYLKEGIWTVGFVTGSLVDADDPNTELLKIFVPTPPNPFTGTMIIVKKAEVRDPGWTIDEAVKTIISAGIIGPSRIVEREVKAIENNKEA